jgi:hypothetical protein
MPYFKLDHYPTPRLGNGVPGRDTACGSRREIRVGNGFELWRLLSHKRAAGDLRLFTTVWSTMVVRKIRS